MTRTKRWYKKRRKAAWRTLKRAQLAHGWVEVAVNLLVTRLSAQDWVDYSGVGWTRMTVTPCVDCDEYFRVHARERGYLGRMSGFYNGRVFQ